MKLSLYSLIHVFSMRTRNNHYTGCTIAYNATRYLLVSKPLGGPLALCDFFRYAMKSQELHNLFLFNVTNM